MKRTWTLVGIMVSLLAGCKRNATPENALFVSGRIDGDSVDISSKIQGRVVNLTVREGDTRSRTSTRRPPRCTRADPLSSSRPPRRIVLR